MKIRVGVLFGGKSVEHEISVISALQAAEYIDRARYEVIPIYIAKDNTMYIGTQIGMIEAYRDIPALLKNSQRVILVPEGNKVALVRYPAKLFSNPVQGYLDLAFPIVHGTNVEDGTLQGYLKMLGLPFVGCDVAASAVGMDKYLMKAVLMEQNIPVLPCLYFDKQSFEQDEDAVVAQIAQQFGYPVIVKPVNLGSSVGITIAKDAQTLHEALEDAFSYAHRVLVERAISNLKEINCAVLGNATQAQASECEQPLGASAILTYEDKYMAGGKGSKGGSKGMATLSRKIPADISDEVRTSIRTMAVKAFRALGCNGVARIDFMIDQDTGAIYLNEINTIPGSLSFYLWEPLGMSYTELLSRLLDLALARKRQEEDITYSFDTNVLAGVKLGGSKGSKGSKRS